MGSYPIYVLAIGSSSSQSTFQGRKQVLQPSGLISKGSKLTGIKQDLQNVKRLQSLRRQRQQQILKSKKFDGIGFYGIDIYGGIQILQSTSHQKDKLLSKKFILESIKKYFNQFYMLDRKRLFLIYTGHGHSNGDWAVETVENPDADRITLQQILTIWRASHQKRIGLHLIIVMDSCFSGEWRDRYLKLKQQKDSIQIFASCSSGQVSYCNNDGGLFLSAVLAQTKDMNEKLKKLKESQKCCSTDWHSDDDNVPYQLRRLFISL